MPRVHRRRPDDTGDLHEAIRSLRHAIELNPALAIEHNMLARVLSAFERHEEALAAAQRSVSLDPLAVMLHTILADVYYFARQYEKAVLSYRMAIELDPGFASAHTDLARALEALGRFDEARAAYETGLRLSGGIAGPSSSALRISRRQPVNVAEARRMLDDLTTARGQRVVSAWGIGAVHASLGGIDEAYRCRWSWPCRRRRRDSSSCACILNSDPISDPTRATGRSSAAWVSTMRRARMARGIGFKMTHVLSRRLNGSDFRTRNSWPAIGLRRFSRIGWLWLGVRDSKPILNEPQAS